MTLITPCPSIHFRSFRAFGSAADSSLRTKTVYIGSHSGFLASVDLHSGSLQWFCKLPGRIESNACPSSEPSECYNIILIYMIRLVLAVEADRLRSLWRVDFRRLL
jgi:outer membrane protein assembly factor BamB